jgi:hypothetical protein
MNRVIILLQQLHAMAVAAEQFGLIAHHGIFAAAELIPVMRDQYSHGVATKPLDEILSSKNHPLFVAERRSRVSISRGIHIRIIYDTIASFARLWRM